MSIQTPKKPQVLIANVQSRTLAFLKTLEAELGCYEFTIIENINQFMELSPDSFSPVLTIVDGQAESALAAESTQILKMTYPVPLFVLHGPETALDFALFKKNGADRLVHFHYDYEIIGDLILELAPVDFGLEIPLAALNSIDFTDIHPEMETNFDLYVHLPTNQKTILIRKKGSLVEEATLTKIKEANQHIYYNKTETKQFLEYARTAVTLRNESNLISLTEKLIKAKKVIFEIMSEFFNSQPNNFEVGKSILDRCRLVLSEYDLLSARTPEVAFKQMVAVSGQQRSFYNDAIYLSNMAALLGHILELKSDEIENLALAGLLHNIGLSEVLEYKPGINWESITTKGKEAYKKYPERSVYLVKSQRVPLNAEVATIIVQHRELSSGLGFPYNLESDKLSPMSKVFQVALRIYEMTSIVAKQPRFTFNAALGELKAEVSIGQTDHDLPLLMKLFKSLKID